MDSFINDKKNIAIYNSDAYKQIDLIKENIDLVLIDPPYDIPSNHHKIYGIPTKINKDKKKYISELKNFDTGFDFILFEKIKKKQKKTNIFIFCNKTLLFNLIKYFDDDKKYSKEILVFCKTSCIPSINQNFLPDIEYILYIKERGVKLQGGYDVRHKWYIQQVNNEDKKKYLHPTIKPQNILQNLIKVSTKENDIVLDCFMGVGSTGVACLTTNRKFIGIEIDPKWYKIAENRIKNELAQTKIFDFL